MKFEVESLPGGQFLIPAANGFFQKVADEDLGEALRVIEGGTKPRKKRGPKGPRKVLGKGIEKAAEAGG